jgi:hypothetical protein
LTLAYLAAAALAGVLMHRHLFSDTLSDTLGGPHSDMRIGADSPAPPQQHSVGSPALD